MVEKSNATKFKVKFFDVDAENSFAQIQATMAETDYHKILQGAGQNVIDPMNPGKGKMLITCLDRSGSMYGQPWDALIHAA